MSKKYKGLADEIVKQIGGKDNISTLTHCMTRLRFVLADNNKVNMQALKGLSGVINVISSGGQLQVVVGTHVDEVYAEIKGNGISNDSSVKDNRKIGAKIIDFVSGTFSPLVPAIAGAGMIKALMSILVLFHLVTKTSQTYSVIGFMADATFYFLPILLGYSAANKLKCNPVLAMVLAGILLHPSLGGLKAAGNPVAIFGLPMRLVSYGSSVVPIILIVWLQLHVERNVKKIIPDAVKVIFVPMITILVTGIIGLTVLGPLGAFVGDFMAKGFDMLGSYGSWIVVFLMATFWPLLVMFGLHHSIVPLSIAQITTLHVENIIGPGAVISNITQGVATLVVAYVTKDKATKQIATSSGITGLMGITEPALYGVTLPKKYPLIAAMVGGACGGLYAGLTNVYRYATGASGLAAIPLYIGENIWNLYNICIALVIAAVVTAVLTYLLSFKYEKDVEEENDDLVTVGNSVIKSPIKGNVIQLKNVKDQAFSSESMGKGIGINPSEGKVVAPFDGEIATLFPTNHAIAIESFNGMELLIHVGLNTVELDGKYFTAHVKEGDVVKQGDVLLTFDIEKIQAAGYETQTPIIIVNSGEYSDVTHDYNDNSNVNFEDTLLLVKP